MKLYHLTAIPPAGVTLMAHGSFTAARQQELVTACSSTLQLYALRPKEGRLDPLMKVDAFAQIRAMDVFRLPGTRRDYIVITSDSGSISILSADPSTSTFRRIHCEPFGKSGCRRIVPGQFLACEPRGRACFIGAVEKHKFAYVLNRDAEENLTISSPLEAHKSNFATFALTSLDVGFENPMFASIEKNYDINSRKMLVYYELDLGLNHVVRKMTSPLRASSFFMLPVPGDTDGPGGILVCSAGFVTYRHLPIEDEHGGLLSLHEQSSGLSAPSSGGATSMTQLETRIPCRAGVDEEDVMVVSGTVYHDKKRNEFFFLFCTEYGDLVKADLSWDVEDGPTELRLAYFDTLPGPALSMRIFRSGYLVAAIEGGDTLLLKFREVNVPDDDPAGGLSVSRLKSQPRNMGKDSSEAEKTPNGSSAHTNGASESADQQLSNDVDESDTRISASRLVFIVRDRLAYLSVAAVIDSLSPLLSLAITGRESGQPHALVCATGRGKDGGVRALKHGMAVVEMSSPHQLPSRLTNVFTLKDRHYGSFHRFIVVSFEERTKVLEVGEAKVEEILSSGFELNESTLCAGQVSTDSFVQVHKGGVRFIPGGRADDAYEWKPPVPSKIAAACCNQEQVVVALSSGALVYFELDSETGSLQEIEKIPDILVPSGGDESVTHGAGDEGTIPSLTIPRVPRGRRRAQFFAAGDGSNSKVRLFRVGQDGTVQSLGLHVAPAPVQSIALVDFGAVDREAIAASRGSKKKTNSDGIVHDPMMALLIGTSQGAVVRLNVDGVTGALGNRRSMFLGPDPVHVESVQVAGVPTCLVMGTKPWVLFPQGGRIEMSALATESMEHAASFSSEQSPDGFVTTCGSKLRLLSIDLVHSLVDSALLPSGLSRTSIPSSTLVSCSYSVSRTRTAGTPRRIFRVAQDFEKSAVVGGRPNGVLRNSTEGPDDLFLVIESDHRRKWDERMRPNAGSAVENGNQQTPTATKKRSWATAPAAKGSWVSRLQLVRLRNEEEDVDSDDEEFDEEDTDMDGSDPHVDLVPKSVKGIDAVNIKEGNRCILTATSSAVLGPPNADPDALSYVVVSTAINLVASATSPDAVGDRRRMEQKDHEVSGALLVYKIDRKSRKLVFLHETRVSEVVYALAAFRDMLLAGVGNTLRLYDLGKRQLLRKSEFKLAVQNRISALAVSGGDRVFVGDVQESVTLFKYIRPGTLIPGTKPAQLNAREGGRFVPIASDVLPRWIVALEPLDHSTVCGSDKFGNVFVLRLPSELAGATGEFAGVISAATDSSLSGARSAPHKLSVEACIHVGSIVTSLTRGTLRPLPSSLPSPYSASALTAGPGDGAIVYATMSGSVGILAPLPTRSDSEFAGAVERAMRMRTASVCGRDHMAYRSSFYPVRNVVDGDLCEDFMGLGAAERASVAEGMGRGVEEMERKLEEIRKAYI